MLVTLCVFGALVFMLLLNASDRKNIMAARERGELIRLRVLKNSLRVQAMDHLISDPFASIVLDEIAQVEREPEGKW